MVRTRGGKSSVRRSPYWFRPGGKYNSNRYDKATKTFKDAAIRQALSTAGNAVGSPVDFSVLKDLYDNAYGEGPSNNNNYEDEGQELDFPEEVDMDPEGTDDVDAPQGMLPGSGGNATAADKQRRTLQRYSYNMGQGKIKRRLISSTYKVMMPVSTAFDGHQVSFIPWENIPVCHSWATIAEALQGSYFWRYIGAKVRIRQCKAHAEIPLSSTSNWPVPLDNVMMFHLKNSPFVAPRAQVFDTIDEFDDWTALCKDQVNGTVTKALPKCTVYRYTHPKLHPIAYDDDLWVQRFVNIDEMYQFEHNETGYKPWRHGWELYEAFHYTRDESGSGSDTYNVLNFPRCDYLYGVLDVPDTNKVTDGNGWPQTICITNKHYTPSWAGYWLGSTIDRETTGNATSYKTVTAIQSSYGHDCKVYNNGTYGKIHQSENPMKPIILAFSRFMNNDNVQAYRAYFDIEIIHEIEVMENMLGARNYGKSDAYPLSTGTGGDWSDIFGMMGHSLLPQRVVTGDQNKMKEMTDRKYMLNQYIFPIYNPWHIPVVLTQALIQPRLIKSIEPVEKDIDENKDTKVVQ